MLSVICHRNIEINERSKVAVFVRYVYLLVQQFIYTAARLTKAVISQ
jgi:hypothetical protein